MPTLISTRLVSLEGVEYDIYLDNGAPGGSGAAVTVRSADLSYKENVRDIGAELVTSKLTVTFSVHDATERAIFTDMVEAVELQYRLRVDRGGRPWWVGFVLVEDVREAFAAFPKDFTVTATDGLARLKDLDYEQGQLPDRATVAAHLVNLLRAVPLQDYYGAGAEYMSVHTTLVPEGLAPAGDLSLIERLRLGFKALRTVDKRGRVKYVSRWNALREVLRTLGARLMFSDGRYVITETAAYARQGAQVTYQQYDITGARIGQQNLNGWTPLTTEIGARLGVDEAVALARGSVGYLAPLRGVQLTYKNFSRQNLIPDYVGLQLTTTTVYREVANFGTDGGAGTLSITGRVRCDLTEQAVALPEHAPIYVRLAVELSIVEADNPTSGISLSRPVTITAAGASYQATVWNEDNPGSPAFFVISMPPRFATSGTTGSFTISTPPVPQGGLLRFRITHRGVFVGGQEYDPSTVAVVLDEMFVESILTGNIADQYNYTTYNARTSAQGVNSLELERDMLFGDGPSDNTFGRVEYSPNGTDWLRTDGWRRWAGGSYLNQTVMPLGGMLAKLLLSLQETQRQRLDVTLIAPELRAHHLVGCDGLAHMLQSGTLDMERDEWRGRWVEVAANFDDTDINGTPTDTGPEITDPDGTNETPPDPPTTPGGGTGGTGGGSPPGDIAPGINTIPTSTEGDAVAVGDQIGGLTVPDLDSPFFGGDIIVVTNPTTGETQQFEVSHDTGYVVGQMTDPGAVPNYTPEGIEWLVPTDDTIAVVDAIAEASFPPGSYVQPDPVSQAQLLAVLRRDHVEVVLFGFDQAVAIGFSSWFWRVGLRLGWRIKRVHFAFGQDRGGAAKVNLKYYDAAGNLRYTIATHHLDDDPLGSIHDVAADVMAGYLRAEVETISGTAPKGLSLHIELLKTRS